MKPSIAVIKVGGDVLLDSEERNGLAENIYDLHELGWKIVILHGGGPQVNQLQSVHGLQANKVAGRRITSKADLQVVKQAIAGEVNVNLVSTLVARGLPAFGCHGASGMLIKATKRAPSIVSGSDNLIDFGEVGDVQSINHTLLTGLLELNQIPVIATLGINKNGRIFNINADTTVIEIAKALEAELLLLITQVGGIFKDIKDPSSLISEITPVEAEDLINQKIITDGMIPKIEEALKLLDFGIKTIAITAARNKGVFKCLASGKDGDTVIRATQIHKVDKFNGTTMGHISSS